MQLAELGAAVAVSARTQLEIEEVTAEIQDRGGHAHAYVCDVSDWQAVIETVGQIESTLGEIDVLVNNAGLLGPLARTWETSPREWARTIDANVNGVYYCTRAVLPGMIERKRGAIINISSRAGSFAAPNWSAYATSKAALDHFTRVLALELKESGVHVIALHPGIVETEMVRTLRTASPQQLPEARRKFFEDVTAQGEVYPPEIPARVIAWLASDAGRELNGETLDIRDDPSWIEKAEKAINRLG
jgi:NAD(P)-dependent dehydrogenase (short-subunit alcohol dehydrogenase family)